MSRTAVTRPGKHGALYLYKFVYSAGPGSHPDVWRTYAYDEEGALMRWHDTNEGDFELLSGPTLVRT